MSERKPSVGLLARPNKRRCFPVELEDRTIYVRSLTNDELDRSDKLDKLPGNCFFIGKALVTEGESPEIQQNDDESDADYALRVQKALADVNVDTNLQSQIISAVSKITKYDPESILKN